MTMCVCLFLLRAVAVRLNRTSSDEDGLCRICRMRVYTHLIRVSTNDNFVSAVKVRANEILSSIVKAYSGLCDATSHIEVVHVGASSVVACIHREQCDISVQYSLYINVERHLLLYVISIVFIHLF